LPPARPPRPRPAAQPQPAPPLPLPDQPQKVYETQKLLEAESQALRRELSEARATLTSWRAKLARAGGVLKEAGDLEHYLEFLAREAALVAAVSEELGLCASPLTAARAAAASAAARAGGRAGAAGSASDAPLSAGAWGGGVLELPSGGGGGETAAAALSPGAAPGGGEARRAARVGTESSEGGSLLPISRGASR
jgi:hypothetical protein